eukprot:9478736-Pyramimonas_sp.AAC.1
MPDKAKAYFEELKQWGLEEPANERIGIASVIAARRWPVAKVARKSYELDAHMYSAKREEDPEEKNKLEREKMFFEVHINKEFPSYSKINGECNEMKAE